ncbi:mechanosensitive ion channel family protein [Thermodesulfobacteriota bacterium]
MENGLKLGRFFFKYYGKPVFALAALLSFSAIVPLLDLPVPAASLLRHVLAVLIIGAVSWLCIRLTAGLEEFVLRQYDIAAEDNLRARKMHTQLQVIKRITNVIIIIIGFAAVLMTFETVRQLGASLLASAGVAGIIIGFAAQRSLATLFAGLQIAITQPIRMDDVVIVENEWGRIEEITLTYVVVRIWDMRRLVLPITYFTERPFQNWTRVSADILGTVFLYVDYTASVQAIREKFFEILDQSDIWDGKVRGVQVTNATERTMEVRALMSAPDASDAWDLRCEVREKLIDFVQQRYPDSLPKVRGEILGDTTEVS